MIPSLDPARVDPRRITRCGTQAIAADADMTAVLEWITRMVADDLAQWSLADGEIRVHLVSGEVFLLAASRMLRLA